MTPLSRPPETPPEKTEPAWEPPRTEWFPEPVWGTKPEQIERNVVIMVFVAFIAGLLLGKIMNPVILKN